METPPQTPQPETLQQREKPQQLETSVPTNIDPKLIALAKEISCLSPDEKETLYAIIRTKDPNKLDDALFQNMAWNLKVVFSRPEVREFILSYGDRGKSALQALDAWIACPSSLDYLVLKWTCYGFHCMMMSTWSLLRRAWDSLRGLLNRVWDLLRSICSKLLEVLRTNPPPSAPPIAKV